GYRVQLRVAPRRLPTPLRPRGSAGRIPACTLQRRACVCARTRSSRTQRRLPRLRRGSLFAQISLDRLSKYGRADAQDGLVNIEHRVVMRARLIPDGGADVDEATARLLGHVGKILTGHR